MILGGLVSLGVDKIELICELKKLKIVDFDIEFETVDRSGISAVYARVIVPEQETHRHLADIEKIIIDSALSETVKTRSQSIFRRLANAEAKVHGTSAGEVHFHEVGALDAIIDVVGSCIGFEILCIDDFACSRIHVGSGFVEMAHGKFPVPPPAVTELLIGVPIYSTELAGELITPTGAAIISTICNSYGTMAQLSLEQTGYGAGTRNYPKFPNTLRMLVGNVAEQPKGGRERVAILETNIDDVSPQILGFVMDRGLELGALDCWFTPIQMKKNRPATMLSMLCDPSKIAELSAMIYAETTTIGIRVNEMERDCLEREIIRVLTQFGEIDTKVARFQGKVINVMPEYEQVKAAALENGVSFSIVQNAVVQQTSYVANK